jgi:hypothetical protein
MVNAAKSLDAECQCQRQGNDACRYTSEDVTLQVAGIEYIFHNQIVLEALIKR